MKIKTSELEGVALDWAVAKADSWPVRISGAHLIDRQSEYADNFSPSTDWSQVGPIKASYMVDSFYMANGWVKCKCIGKGHHDLLVHPEVYGPSELIAACRAIVAAKLGYEVEIPDELE